MNDQNTKQSKNELTRLNKGEYLVGIKFNPSGDDRVGYIKWKAAQLINEIDGLQPIERAQGVDDQTWAEYLGAVGRLKALAITAIEEGAMWGVKAATKAPNA